MRFRRRKKGYRVKKREIGNPDDPVWQKIVEMEEVRKAAMRKATETGERYRDPYEEAWLKELEERRR
jgi:hypothetical protein